MDDVPRDLYLDGEYRQRRDGVVDISQDVALPDPGTPFDEGLTTWICLDCGRSMQLVHEDELDDFEQEWECPSCGNKLNVTDEEIDQLDVVGECETVGERPGFAFKRYKIIDNIMFFEPHKTIDSYYGFLNYIYQTKGTVGDFILSFSDHVQTQEEFNRLWNRA